MNQKFYALPQQRQQSILNGAIRVFARYSYKKASTDEIAKSAGISKALIFHYFGSKKELYLFLYQYAEAYVVQQMSALHDYAKTDFFDILADAQICKMKILSVYPDIMLFLMQGFFEENAEVRPDIDKDFDSILADSSTRFLSRADASKFREGITAEQALNIILWMADGFMRSRTPEKLKDLDAVSQEYLSYLNLLKRQFYRPELIEGDENHAGN